MVKTASDTYQAGKKGIFSGNGGYYKRSLIMILFVASIPGLVIGSLMYWMAGGRMESELLKLHNTQIEQRAHNIDDQFSNLELMLAHWAFDPKFDSTLNGRDLTWDFERAHDITQTLIVMQGTSTLAKKVELFLDGSSTGRSVKFDPEYSVVPVGSTSEAYKRLLNQNQITYWTQWAFDPSRPEDKDLTLVHYIPGGSLKSFGTLLVRMNNEKVSRLLQTMMPYNKGEAFLMEDSGDLFVSANQASGKSELVNSLMAEIQERGGKSGSFFYDTDGTTYVVSYGGISRIATNWTYVAASPITSITSPVLIISKLILIVSMSTLLLALLLAWFASRRIYSPINRLVQNLLGGQAAGGGQEDVFVLIERQWDNLNRESHELNDKLAEQLTHVKESFLHQLLQGYLYAYSEDDLRNRMERFKWVVEDRQFVIIYVQLTGITSLEGKFKDGDEGLITFAAVNIIGELASLHFEQNDTINFHDLTAGLLLMMPAGQSPADRLKEFSEELTQAINRILKMRVTLAISRPVERVSDIPVAFENARQAAAYRNFGIENQVLDMEQQEQQGGGEAEYPFTLERELIQAMRTGQEADAYRLLEAFLEALSCKGAKEIDVQQGMLHLLGSIQHAVMVSGIQPNQLFKGVNLYESLSQIREHKLILEWFGEKVVAPFLRELLQRTDAQVKRIIEQTMIYLQANYMNDISLDNCADHTGTNPFFLSKSFKQVTGKNFIDYLTELRMDKAKELLRDTELKINDVAEQVGYQHSYFNRIFKKLEGMTPSRYRELSRMK